MFINTWTTAGLTMAFVVLSVETEEQSNACVWVGVDANHNSSEMSCDAPEKPLNGGYVSDTNVGGQRYNTGDTIQYYCNHGHQLIGQVNRTCDGTSKGWEPEEPYCEPEYIGHLMRRLSGIEDQMRVIEQRITTMENNTSQIGQNISDMRNEISAMNSTMSDMKTKVLAIDNNVLAVYNMSITEFVKWHMIRNRDRLGACTDITRPIDEDTVSKCMTMQMGVRNGRGVSVYEWVLEDYNSKVPQSGHHSYFSPVFYQTVPGYKLWLRAYINWNNDMDISLYVLPGEYDDQLSWPFKQNHDLTVLTNNGTEVLHRSFSRQHLQCQLDRPTSATGFSCDSVVPEWADVWPKKKHILNDDSVVIKLYLYN